MSDDIYWKKYNDWMTSLENDDEERYLDEISDVGLRNDVEDSLRIGQTIIVDDGNHLNDVSIEEIRLFYCKTFIDITIGNDECKVHNIYTDEYLRGLTFSTQKPN